MCFQLRDALRVGCIGLSKHFFTLTMETREMLKILDDELRNFCILVVRYTHINPCVYVTAF
jgi:hypothetical protein|tara:strand:+ start:4200 stop:4382 length:183 start_codon:yes stop_codon:yes gene_type:complete